MSIQNPIATALDAQRCAECVGMGLCARCGERLARIRMKQKRTIRRRARRARREAPDAVASPVARGWITSDDGEFLAVAQTTASTVEAAHEAALARKDTELEKLREALRFYMAEDHYEDHGEVARAALASTPEKS